MKRNRDTVIEMRATRAEMIERLAGELARITSARPGESAADVAAFARASAERLVDEAIAASDGKTVTATITARPGN